MPLSLSLSLARSLSLSLALSLSRFVAHYVFSTLDLLFLSPTVVLFHLLLLHTTSLSLTHLLYRSLFLLSCLLKTFPMSSVFFTSPSLSFWTVSNVFLSISITSHSLSFWTVSPCLLSLLALSLSPSLSHNLSFSTYSFCLHFLSLSRPFVHYQLYLLITYSLSTDRYTLLKSGPTPASFSFIFVFSNKHYNFYTK